MSYFEFDRKRIYYEERGTGRPLLFLHGNGASSNMFAEVVKEYERDFRTVLIDFLGHGKSDRLEAFPTDLWYWEAEQAIRFLREKAYGPVDIIGSSGGALAAINVALEVPELVRKVIADSFEGERTLKAFTEHVREDREASKRDENGRLFYYYMHGGDWEQVVDQDTDAIVRHDREIGTFFHKPLQSLRADILLTGSRGDEFACAQDAGYFERVYGDMLRKIGHGRMHIFPEGGHPAILSCPETFFHAALGFLKAP